MKKKSYRIIGILIILVISFWMFYYYFQRPENKEYNYRYFCNVNEDCLVKTVCDKSCSPCPCIGSECVNKDWNMDCSVSFRMACPPAPPPPFSITCKCANNICEEIRYYIACGCGCCGGVEPEEKCIYHSKEDDIFKIIEDDKKATQDPICPTVGCSLGIKYIYCD